MPGNTHVFSDDEVEKCPECHSDKTKNPNENWEVSPVDLLVNLYEGGQDVNHCNGGIVGVGRGGRL